jgi:hypothetical protein
MMARSVLLIFYKELKNALALTAIHDVFKRNPFRSTYFLPTAAKRKQKAPLEDNALHPTITPSEQVARSRSRRRTAQSPVHGDCPTKLK